MLIPSSNTTRRSGFALLMVLILVGVSIAILAGVMYRGYTVALLNQRNNDYTICCNAAEAAVEKVYASMAYYFQSYNVSGVASQVSNYRNYYPNEVAFWNNFVFSDGQGHANQTYVSQVGTYSGTLPSAYTGLFTTNAPVYRIISNAKLANSQYNVIGTAQEDVLLALVPLTTWAIFYNGLLEFTQCATMSVYGRVQANGPIYVGTTASLDFYSGVSTTATVTAPFVDGLSSGWTTGTPSTWKTTFHAVPGYSTNVQSVTVSLNMTNSHFLIDIPPAGEDPNSTTGQQRLYNQAQMVLIVTNTASSPNPTVQLILQNSPNGQVPGSDPSPVILTYTNATPGIITSNLPFLSLTNSAYDQREYDTNIITQINVTNFASWITTNASVQGKLPSSVGIYPTILYVADRRTNNARQLSSVRLVNGTQLPANNGMGFTVATPNPLYVQGNYNVQTASSATNASAGTSNTTYTVPAALLSDSLTVLSSHWSDSVSFTSTYSTGNANYAATDNNTINAAIITGTMPSTGITGTTFSGGVHNLPRLLEDWSTGTKNLWLNTSILRLWDSQMATNQFRNPAGFTPSPVNPYYNPPTRHYSFDLNFLNPAKVPPGIPVALVPIRFAWTTPPPNTINYTNYQHN
ncbi:MAG: hypothetical protein WCH99_01380 [Verrucomicrobiota bacterium]